MKVYLLKEERGDTEFKNLPLYEPCIVTFVPVGRSIKVGEVIINIGNGRVIFPESNRSGCSTDYRGRCLNKGERLVFEGE
jgi:hypothetical protein